MIHVIVKKHNSDIPFDHIIVVITGPESETSHTLTIDQWRRMVNNIDLKILNLHNTKRDL